MEAFFHKHILPISAVLFVTSFVVFSTQVLAFGKPTDVGGAIPNTTAPRYQPNTGINNNATGSAGQQYQSGQGQSRIPAFAQVHLQDAKLKACQAISSSLVTRSTHLVSLVTQMEKTFTSIAGGVEQYYLTKVVPTGTTLSSYDALVADITTKQNALAPLVQAAQTDATGFSCTGNNPAAQLTQYRTDMQAVLTGLQDYRTSIKDLIVAVRTLPSVNPAAAASPTSTPTPTPTVIPTATP